MVMLAGMATLTKQEIVTSSFPKVVVAVEEDVVVMVKDPSGTRTSSGSSSRWRNLSVLCKN